MLKLSTSKGNTKLNSKCKYPSKLTNPSPPSLSTKCGQRSCLLLFVLFCLTLTLLLISPELWVWSPLGNNTAPFQQFVNFNALIVICLLYNHICIVLDYYNKKNCRREECWCRDKLLIAKFLLNLWLDFRDWQMSIKAIALPLVIPHRESDSVT